jgi:hypothetical protein
VKSPGRRPLISASSRLIRISISTLEMRSLSVADMFYHLLSVVNNNAKSSACCQKKWGQTPFSG